MLRNRLIVKISILLCFSIILGACGGGSSVPRPAPRPPSSPPPPPPPPPPDPTPTGGNFDTAEFRDNSGLVLIDPIPAYEAGLDGSGVTVAIVDTGIDEDHVEFTGRIHPASQNVVDATEDVDDDDGHGTFVAGIIGANKNGLGMHGVAFRSSLLVLRADTTGSCFEDDGCTFTDFSIVNGLDIAVAQDARVVNLSLGGEGTPIPQLTSALEQAAAAGMLIVIAAGNEEADLPSDFAFSALSPEIQDNVLIVGSVDFDRTLSNFSNRAGPAADHFVVAPGNGVTSTLPDNFTGIGNGTSFATPHVSGAAALLFQMFPNLEGDEVAEILKLTAEDLGQFGVDAIFGHGLINLENAIQPIGTQSVGIEQTERIDLPSMQMTGASMSSAFGDAMQNMQSLSSVIFLDDFDRAYEGDLRTKATPVQPGWFDPLATALTARGEHFVTVKEAGPVRASVQIRSLWQGGGLLDALPRAVQDRLTPQAAEAEIAIRTGPQSHLMIQSGRFAGGGMPVTELAGDSVMTRIAPGAWRTAASYRYSLDRWSLAGSVQQYDYRSSPFSPPDARKASAFVTGLSARRQAGPVALQTGLSVIDEDNAILGARQTGALRMGDGATSLIARTGADMGLGDEMLFSLHILAGTTEVHGAGASLFRDMGRLLLSGFEARLSRHGVFADSDAISFGIEQPLRVEHGSALLSVGTDFDVHTETIGFTRFREGLSPAGRELAFSAGYTYQAENRFSLSLQAFHNRDWLHREGLNLTGLMLRLRGRF